MTIERHVASAKLTITDENGQTLYYDIPACHFGIDHDINHRSNGYEFWGDIVIREHDYVRETIFTIKAHCDSNDSPVYTISSTPV